MPDDKTKASGASAGTAEEKPLDPPTRTGSMSIVKAGSDYVTVRISSISKATGYEIVWREASVTDIEGTLDVGSSGRYTIDGLTPETDYVFNYRGYNDDGIGPFMSTGRTATTLPNRPDDWEWWTRIESGGDIDLSADEWNTFCERINEFRAYSGLSEYAFTTVETGDYIYASTVNRAVSAIRAMNPLVTPPRQVSSGSSDITAAFFYGLSNALNSIE